MDEQAQKAVATTSVYPQWPISRPGPRKTPLSPGQRPVQGRSDQVLEVGYDQEHGIPAMRGPVQTLPATAQAGKSLPDQGKM